MICETIVSKNVSGTCHVCDAVLTGRIHWLLPDPDCTGDLFCDACCPVHAPKEWKGEAGTIAGKQEILF